MVIYVVCFDLSASLSDQFKQLLYWLEFLDSSLSVRHSSPLGPSHHQDSTWSILLAGLRADAPNSPLHPCDITSKFLLQWQHRWPHLPIKNELVAVSSLKSVASIKLILQLISDECKRIFDLHTMCIPTLYRNVLNFVQSTRVPQNNLQLFSRQQLVEGILESTPNVSIDSVQSAIQYLHAIGRLVLLPNGFVCTNPMLIPRIAAKFVSPREVQLDQLQKEAYLLTDERIRCILGITPKQPRHAPFFGFFS